MTTDAQTKTRRTSFRHRVAEGVRTIGYAIFVAGVALAGVFWFIARLIDDR